MYLYPVIKETVYPKPVCYYRQLTELRKIIVASTLAAEQMADELTTTTEVAHDESIRREEQQITDARYYGYAEKAFNVKRFEGEYNIKKNKNHISHMIK